MMIINENLKTNTYLKTEVRNPGCWAAKTVINGAAHKQSEMIKQSYAL